MKDQDDKVQRDLKALDRRISELKRKRDLDRQSRDFAFEESALDDSDRRLNVRRQTGGTAAAAATGRGDNSEQTRVGAPPAAANDVSLASMETPAASPTDFGAATPGSSGFGGGTDVHPGGTSPRAVSASDARPVVGSLRMAPGGDDDDLDDLEVQRRRLQVLAGELKTRAAALQTRATESR